MAHEILYKHPNDEVLYSVDFTDELPNDSSISASSAVTAVDSAEASNTAIIGTVAQSGMSLTCVLQAGTNAEDYRITFTGRGTTTSRDASKIVEMRVRSKLLGD